MQLISDEEYKSGYMWQLLGEQREQQEERSKVVIELEHIAHNLGLIVFLLDKLVRQTEIVDEGVSDGLDR